MRAQPYQERDTTNGHSTFLSRNQEKKTDLPKVSSTRTTGLITGLFHATEQGPSHLTYPLIACVDRHLPRSAQFVDATTFHWAMEVCSPLCNSQTRYPRSVCIFQLRFLFFYLAMLGCRCSPGLLYYTLSCLNHRCSIKSGMQNQLRLCPACLTHPCAVFGRFEFSSEERKYAKKDDERDHSIGTHLR